MLCDNLEGWDGVVSGREVQEGGYKYIYLGLIHVVVWQKPIQHCKEIIFQSKKKKKIPRIQTFLTSYVATTLVQAHIISHLFSLRPALLSCNLFLRKQLEGRNPAKTQVMSWFSSFQSPPESSLKPK